jgi:hypothetical protein
MSTANQGFWKYASSFSGTFTVEDLFLKWAASESMTINDAKLAWTEVNKDIVAYFPNRTATVTMEVTGDAAEVKEIMQGGISSTSTAMPASQTVHETTDIGTETPSPITEEEKTSLADSLLGEEEGAGATTPPATPPAV